VQFIHWQTHPLRRFGTKTATQLMLQLFTGDGMLSGGQCLLLSECFIYDSVFVFDQARSYLYCSHEFKKGQLRENDLFLLHPLLYTKQITDQAIQHINSPTKCAKVYLTITYQQKN